MFEWTDYQKKKSKAAVKVSIDKSTGEYVVEFDVYDTFTGEKIQAIKEVVSLPELQKIRDDLDAFIRDLQGL